MLKRFLLLMITISGRLFSQQLQLHYDPRHGVDPVHAPRNFSTLYFEYFKPAATDDSSFVRAGSSLVKTQCDFTGQNGNVGKLYFQYSQTVKFWDPNIYLDLEYSGGVGIAEPGSYGFYITNTFALGSASSFQWHGTVFSMTLAYTYTAFIKPSRDVHYCLYWWQGLFNYSVEFAGDIQFWTQNKDRGDGVSPGLQGKWFCVFGEPQVWYRLTGNVSLGTKVTLYYHVLTTEETFQVYPTLAIRYLL